MLSCLPVSLFGDIISGKYPLAQWSYDAAEMGLDAFDISILFVGDRTPAGVSRMLRSIESGGLPLSMISIYPDFTAPDEFYCEKQLIRCLSDISIASDLGASYVRITAGQYYPGTDEDKKLDSVCRAFEKSADFAEKCGVRLVWENHSKPGAWEAPDFNYNRTRLFKMMKRLSGSRIRMNFDTANAYLLDLGTDFLENCFPDVESIHLNDVASKKTVKFAGIGSGTVPVADYVRVLKKNGFHGPFSVEEASFEGIEGVRKYVSAAKELLKNCGFEEAE